jgi:hypothetical protein
MSLVVLLATSVTATVGLVAHAAVGHSDARRATPMTPEAARQRV